MKNNTNFEWRFDSGENNKSALAVIKNDGKFKSLRHKKYFDSISNIRTKENLKECFGIDIEENEAKIVEVEAWIRWADYGTRSVIPYTVFYILDDVGIKASYRIRYRGNLRDGTGPDTKRTEIKWQRDSSIKSNSIVEEETKIDALKKLKEEEEKKNLEYVDGKVKDRVTLKVDSSRIIAEYASDFGTVFVYKFTSGNKVLIWKTGRIHELDNIKSITGTIKAFAEYKGTKQTVLTRCKLS